MPVLQSHFSSKINPDIEKIPFFMKKLILSNEVAFIEFFTFFMIITLLKIKLAFIERQVCILYFVTVCRLREGTSRRPIGKKNDFCWKVVRLKIAVKQAVY